MPNESLDVFVALFAVRVHGPDAVDAATPVLKQLKASVAKAVKKGWLAEIKKSQPALLANGKPKLTKTGKPSMQTVTRVELTPAGAQALAEHPLIGGGAILGAVRPAVEAGMTAFFDAERQRLQTAIFERLAETLGGATAPASADTAGTHAPNHRHESPAAPNHHSTPTNAAPSAAGDVDWEHEAFRAWDLLHRYPDNVGAYVEIPKLFHQMRKRHPKLALDKFHDLLRKLENAGTVNFSRVNSPDEVDEPALGISERGKLIYYVRWTEGDGR